MSDTPGPEPEAEDPWERRTRELEGLGLDRGHAFAKARLEHRIAKDWPLSWGDELEFTIYGDFHPVASFGVPALGIRIVEGVVENPALPGTAQGAFVSVPSRSPAGIEDATRRINLFLGLLAHRQLGRGGLGWWSYIVHGTKSGSLLELRDEFVLQLVDVMLQLRPEVRLKLEAALGWLRDSRRTFWEEQRETGVRSYAVFWNAFECLVEAAHLMWPQETITPREKNKRIAQYWNTLKSPPTVDQLERLYHDIANPGFVPRAKYALRMSVGSSAEDYVLKCFDRHPKTDRLYFLRNAINHGAIDIANPDETVRVQAREDELAGIVGHMLAALLRVCQGAVIVRPAGRETSG